MESANHFQWFVLNQKVTKSSRLDLFAKKVKFLPIKSPLFISSLRRDSGGNIYFASIEEFSRHSNNGDF